METSFSATHLIIFTRYPSPGKVKTRLAAKTSPEIACTIFETILEHVCREASAASAYKTIHLCCTEADDLPAFRRWLGNTYSFMVQRGENIGARMKNAFEDVFKQGAASAVLIGTDLPMLDCSVMEEAFTALQTNDFCLGPAHDGGYYCIGMNSYNPDVFDRQQWSTGTVFDHTKLFIENAGYSCKVLPRLHDIDTVHDLEVWFRQQSKYTSHSLVTYIKNESIDLHFFPSNQQ